MPMKTYTVYLFSEDHQKSKPLWEKDFKARDERDADNKGHKLVLPVLNKFDDAEDWVVEEKVSRRAKTDPKQELAIRALLVEDTIEHEGKGKVGTLEHLEAVVMEADIFSRKASKTAKLDTGSLLRKVKAILNRYQVPQLGQWSVLKNYKPWNYTKPSPLAFKIQWPRPKGMSFGLGVQLREMDEVLTYKFGKLGFEPDGHLYERIFYFAVYDKSAKTNAKIVEVPNTFHAVKVEPPKKVRKEYPFEGYIDFQGLQIDVENAKGSTRSGTGPEGDWSTFMHAHYGEIRGTEGTDGDMLDVYVGDNHDSSIVVVIHQYNPWDGAFDEDKVVIGCESVEESIGLYKKQYDRPGFYRPGEHTVMPIGAFWRWCKDTRNKGKKVKVAKLAAAVIAALTPKTAAALTPEKALKKFLNIGERHFDKFFKTVPKEWGVQGSVGSRYDGQTDWRATSLSGKLWVYVSSPADQGQSDGLSANILASEDKLSFSFYSGNHSLGGSFSVGLNQATKALRGIEKQWGPHIDATAQKARKLYERKKNSPSLSPDDVTQFLKKLTTPTGGRNRDVYYQAPKNWSAEPMNRQRLDHYGNQGEGWDDAWYPDYADPLKAEATKQVEARFGKGLFWVQVGDKGHIELTAKPQGMAAMGLNGKKAVEVLAARTFSYDDVTNVIRRMKTNTAGGNHDTTFWLPPERSGRPPQWEAMPDGKEREDHEQWEGEWQKEYADPLRADVEKELAAKFGRGLFDVTIEEKGGIEVAVSNKGQRSPWKKAMWKRGYVEESPGSINAMKAILGNTLAMLRALSWNHWTAHWQAQGESSYGDHLLFERLYDATLKEIDTLAEKMVAMFGPQAVDAAEQAKYTAFMLHQWAEDGDAITRSLGAENDFQMVIAKAVEGLEGMGSLSLGLDDFLRTMANDHETAYYLLKQRNRNTRVARVLTAKEFGSDDALKKYLKDHPKADRKQHTVTKDKGKGEGGKKDEGKGGKGSLSDKHQGKVKSQATSANSAAAKARDTVKENGFGQADKTIAFQGRATLDKAEKVLSEITKALESGDVPSHPPAGLDGVLKAFAGYDNDMQLALYGSDKGTRKKLPPRGPAVLAHDEITATVKALKKMKKTWGKDSLGEKFKGLFKSKKAYVDFMAQATLRYAAQVGTDTASIYAIAPEQLANMIESSEWTDWHAQGSIKADDAIRQHGGAVFHTGADGFWDVTVPGAVSEAGLMAPYGTPQFGRSSQ